MPIKASAAAEIRQLTAALCGEDEVRREAAIARLAVIGPRAVDALLRTYATTADRDTRIAVLRTLEPMSDRRTIAVARDAIGAGGDLAQAATSALRGLLESQDDKAGTEALDVLVATAMDRSLTRSVRLSAVDALQGMPDAVRIRIAEALESDPDSILKTRASDLAAGNPATDAVWQDAVEGRLPDRPAALREAAQARAASAALGSIQKMIDAVRTREGAVDNPDRSAEWRNLRGALHQALALRGSRVAVYDLREALEGAHAPLPTSFLAALHVVGDQSCLEPIAAAYAGIGAVDARWKVQLAATFRAIARREKVTSRHAIAKRINSRWPNAARDLTASA
jgi:hypothetical protein